MDSRKNKKCDKTYERKNKWLILSHRFQLIDAHIVILEIIFRWYDS